MLGHWLLGLKNEYMRKSKKELVEEIMQLKFKLSQKYKEESDEQTYEVFRIMSLSAEVKSLKEELEIYKNKYADELQKRLELAKMVEEIENGNSESKEEKAFDTSSTV